MGIIVKVMLLTVCLSFIAIVVVFGVIVVKVTAKCLSAAEKNMELQANNFLKVFEANDVSLSDYQDRFMALQDKPFYSVKRQINQPDAVPVKELTEDEQIADFNNEMLGGNITSDELAGHEQDLNDLYTTLLGDKEND